MKNTLLFCLIAFSGFTASAQTDGQRQQLESMRSYLASSDYVYPYVDTPPFYPGGSENWGRYVSSSSLMLNAGLEAARKGLQPGFYNVVVRFAVNADGSVGEAKIVNKPVGYGLEEAAIALVRGSGHWTPANVEGAETRSWLQLTIRFHVAE